MYPPSHPNTILKRVIEESGSATLVEDRPQPQPFGSAWSIYRFPTATARLVWDGRESWAFLQGERAGPCTTIHRCMSLRETVNMKLFREQVEELSMKSGL